MRRTARLIFPKLKKTALITCNISHIHMFFIGAHKEKLANKARHSTKNLPVSRTIAIYSSFLCINIYIYVFETSKLRHGKWL